MKSKIKICGIRRMEDVHAVNECLPDYIGFVFDPTRRRYIAPEQARMLREALHPDIQVVGVFVDADSEWIVELAERNIFDVIQLHGQETEAVAAGLKRATGKPVIKAVSVQTKEDIVQWNGSAADYLLLDRGAGGTGRAFDWSLISGCTHPFFLAGGIHAGNLKEALRQGAYCIDISGGAETDGFKDPEKIRELVQFMREADRL